MAGDASTGEPRAIVVMGVAGCGKTVVGEALARRLDGRFIEGDRLHPAANVARMASGQPLTDDLREGWLDAVGDALAAGNAEGHEAVAACSALRRTYRDRLRRHCPALVFVHLEIDKATARGRVGRRQDHFMPASLVESQFAALETLQGDEAGVTLDGALPVRDLVEMASNAVRLADARKQNRRPPVQPPDRGKR